MNIYYLSNFNNYYNRQLKKYNTRKIDDFSDFVIYTESNKNFNPNDNVRTVLTVNIADDIEIDYLLTSEDNVNIVSKWYVIEKTRNRKGQWMLDLRRDLLADYFEEISNSPFFCEKGWINPSNPFIYNSENMTFNQIKKKEVSLSDKTNTAWIVGYLANNYYEGLTLEGDNYNTYFNRDIARTANYSASYSEYKALSDLGTLYTGALTSNQELQFVIACLNFQYGHLISDRTGFVEYVDNNANLVCEQYAKEVMAVANYAATTRASNKFYISIGTIGNYITNYQPNLDDAKQLNGMLIKNTDSTGPAYFYISLTNNGTETKNITPPVNSSLYTQVQNHITKLVQNAPDQYISAIDPSKFYWDNSAPNKFKIKVPVQSYTLSVSEEPPLLKCRTTLATKVSDETITKIKLQDAPYTMFCSPYSDVVVRRSSGVSILYGSEGKVNQEMCSAIGTDLGGGAGGSSYIYDLQLLPYCPIPQIYNDDGEIDLTNIDERSYAIITAEDSDGTYTNKNNCGILLFPKVSSFNGIINLSEPVTISDDPIEFKLQNETRFCRLVSPNYAGAFEFTPTKNGGFSAVEFNCTYKPYQPYIHINPKFNSGYLYGGDFNDNRGLICGGNFSIPLMTNAWENYQIQNKSYMESFNRQIENMEVNNSIQREKEIWSAVTGGVSSTISGTTAGALAGGPVGAAIGGVSTLAANTIGAIKDVELNDQLRAEGIDYTKDMFGYQLQNIKALPTTMSRTSAFDINNKIFPFIEFYECTSLEENAFKNKIKYNGMTIMTIGKLTDFTDYNKRYIKGQIIRLQDDSENSIGEFHEAVEIASELAKGVFI